MNPFTHLWQSTLCAGVAALAALAFRRASAHTRYNIWLAASIKFLIPLGLLADLGRYGATSFARLTPNAAPSDALRWFSVATDPAASGFTLGIERLAPAVGVTIWAAGAIALTVWRWRQWAAVSRVVRASTPLDQGREAAALRHAPRSSAHPTSIALVQCRSSIEPGIVGPFRPVLLWPEGLSDHLSDDELRAIVAHEAAHVDRRDTLTSLVHTLVETVFWFNPVVWWIGAQLVNERERACDEVVMHTHTDTRSYAEGILKVCGFCLRSPAAFVAGVGSSNLRTRIERILTRSTSAPLSLLGRAVLATILMATIGAPIAAGAINGRQDESKVYRLPDASIEAPKIRHEAKPVYTREAMEAKIQGRVQLTAVVKKDGTVGEVQVVESLDREHGLDNAAIHALKQWIFDPASKDGQPVNVRVDVEMTFTLK
jgi:bla regulator protein BlaR1